MQVSFTLAIQKKRGILDPDRFCYNFRATQPIFPGSELFDGDLPKFMAQKKNPPLIEKLDPLNSKSVHGGF